MRKMKMKTLIIYISIHHKNTEKIAGKMAGVFEAKLLTPGETDANSFSEYDLIGFGSGIYFGKYHESLLNIIDRLPVLKNKKAFILNLNIAIDRATRAGDPSYPFQVACPSGLSGHRVQADSQ